MKKLTSLLFALVFALAGICSAAAEGVVFTNDYFTLTLPENWIIDTENLTSSEETQELGHFYDSGEVGLLVSAYLVRLEDTEDQPVWSAETGIAQEYVDLVLADFEDSHPEYLGTFLAGEVPFLLIKGGDDYGEFLYAETVLNGMAFEFEAYVTDEDGAQYPVTEEYVAQLRAILESFQLVKAE